MIGGARQRFGRGFGSFVLKGNALCILEVIL